MFNRIDLPNLPRLQPLSNLLNFILVLAPKPWSSLLQEFKEQALCKTKMMRAVMITGKSNRLEKGNLHKL